MCTYYADGCLMRAITHLLIVIPVCILELLLRVCVLITVAREFRDMFAVEDYLT